MRRPNKKQNLRLESLENRNLLAGNVTVELSDADSRDLDIVGDNSSNGILVEQISQNRIRVTGQVRHGSATTINGSSQPVVFTVTDDVRISMLGGGDFVRIEDLDLDQRTHNDLEVDMGSGNFDDLVMRDVRTSDDIFIDLGSGRDFMDLFDVRANDDLTIEGGTGSDAMIINSSRAEDIRVFAGSGNDELHMRNNVVTDLLRIELDSGSDELLLHGNNSPNPMIEGGSGTDRLYTSWSNTNNFWAWWASNSMESESTALPGISGIRQRSWQQCESVI